MRRCCVSKGRAAPERAPLLCHGGDSAQTPTGLASLRLSALRKRATAVGANAAQVEEAEDAGNPRGALIALIVQIQGDSSHQALRVELAQEKLSALKRRARAAGVDEAALDAAIDGAAPKDDVIELILGRGVGGESGDAGRRDLPPAGPVRRRSPSDSRPDAGRRPPARAASPGAGAKGRAERRPSNSGHDI